MRRALFLISIVMLAACNGKKTANTEDAAENTAAPVSYVWMAEELPNLSVSGDEGVAGAVLNIVDGRLTIWGGANFPDKPAAEGGKKRVWGSVYALTENGWEWQGDRKPIAYAATAQTPSGLAVVGGNDGTSSTCEAQFWPENVHIADLPYKVENAALAYGNDGIFVVGGQGNEPLRSVLFMPEPSNPASSWQPLPDLPVSPRVQCSAAWLDGRLYVAGGYDPTDGTVNATLISWAPGDSTWTFVDSMRKPGESQTWTLVGGTMLADETAHCLLFVGGVDANIFQDAIARPARLQAARNEGNKTAIERLEREAAEYMHHEPEWYRFNSQLISYNPTVGEFRHELTHPSLARAGAAVLMRDSVIYVVNGELKPGIRSNTAVKLKRLTVNVER